MENQLYIPQKLKVGYNKRSDTYTANLGFVIYQGVDGVWKQEKAWERWREKNMRPLEFDNEAMEGFVLNKNVGGYRGGWNSYGREAKIRIYDPRDFEIEITLENLLWVLGQCDCTKGKGLEGKFVYAWSGNSLVLLPEGSAEYKNSQKFTELQGQKIEVTDLKPGFSYETKKQKIFTYLGYFSYLKKEDWGQKKGFTSYSKKLIFAGEPDYWSKSIFHTFNDTKELAKEVTTTAVDNFAELLDKYSKTFEGRVIKEFELYDAKLAKNGNNIEVETFLIPTKRENVYANISIEPEYDSQSLSWYNSRNYKFLGYKVTPYQLVTINDTELIVRPTKAKIPNQDKILTYVELQSMGIKTINIVTVNNEKRTLII